VTWGAAARFRLCAVIEHDGAEYEIVKDFEAKEQTISARNGGETITSASGVQKRITEMVGTSQANIFESTACVRQNELERVASKQSDRNALVTALEEAVTGGGEGGSAAEALKLLDRAVSQREKGLQKHADRPGPLRELMDRIADSRDRIDKEEAKNAELEEKRQKADEIKAHIEDLEAKLRGLGDAVEASARAQDYRDRLSEAQEDLARAQKDKEDVEKLARQIERVEGGLAEAAPTLDSERIAEVENALGELRATRAAKAEQFRTSRDAAAQARAEYEARAGGKRRGRAVGYALSFAAALGGLLAFWFTDTWAWILGTLAGAITFAVVQRATAPPRQLRDKATEAERFAAGIEAVLNRLSEDERAACNSVGCSDPGEFATLLGKVKPLVEERRKWRDQLDGKLSGRMAADVTEAYNKALTDVAVLRRQLEGATKAPMLSPEEYHTKKREMEETEAALGDLRAERERLLGAAGELQADPEALAADKERLADDQRRLARQQQNVEAMELARRVIQQAQAEALEGIKGAVSEAMSRYTERITGGRYADLNVADDLQVTASVPKAGGEVEPGEALSEGTIDQIYLAARLALLDMIYAQAGPPLVLDDPFAAFDDERAAAAAELLGEIAKRRQVFVLTTSKAYDDRAEKVIVLDAPDRGN